MSDESIRKRSSFFQHVYGGYEGYVCIVKRQPTSKTFEEHFYQWPAQENKIQAIIEAWSLTHDLYYCPMLFEEPRRTKENVRSTPVAWADLDECSPDLMLVEPTVSLESSPGRYQALWRLDPEVPASDAEDISRRIAYYHAKDGADKSGWDLTQLLRIPFTYNYKYSGLGTPAPMVQIRRAQNLKYPIETFTSLYPQAAGYEATTIPFPEESELTEEADTIVQRHKYRLMPAFFQHYEIEPEDDWSKHLWNLQLLALESGMTREETFIVARDSACNKYKRDGRSDLFLWKEVCRAWAQFESTLDHHRPTTKVEGLLSAEDLRWANSETTIVEDYIEWAKTVGDAAHQYHQAGGFVVLSSLLAGAVKLPTSFGTVVPNLWFMILADTTLTRKSTAMDLAMDMLSEVDADAVLATDGSIEGLFTSLSYRPGRPSVFLRDEFSGLLEMIAKKDYYAGMAETLTKLYDGKFQKRVLRKETIEIKDPILILFAGGIRDRILGLLTHDQIASGFLPRFIFITAESDINKVRPIGPPTDATLGARNELLGRFSVLYNHYNAPQVMTVAGRKIVAPARTDVTLSPEAWHLYNKLDGTMMAQALASSMPDLLTPTFARLAISGLKAATLLAAAARTEERVVVNEGDLIKAFAYVDTWREYTLEVIAGVGRTAGEREMQNILKAIQKKEGVTRSQLMQNYHLMGREADTIFGTLEQRGLITRVKHGRTEKFYPTGGLVRG